jgi:hypothetical protein
LSQNSRHSTLDRSASDIIPIIVAGVPNNEARPDEQAAMAFPDARGAALKMPLAVDDRGFDGNKNKFDRGGSGGTPRRVRFPRPSKRWRLDFSKRRTTGAQIGPSSQPVLDLRDAKWLMSLRRKGGRVV